MCTNCFKIYEKPMYFSHTVFTYMFLVFLEMNTPPSPPPPRSKSSNRLVFVVQMECVYCDAGIEILNYILVNIMLPRLTNNRIARDILNIYYNCRSYKVWIVANLISVIIPCTLCSYVGCRS
jgi:hypothetical protein